MIPISLSLKDKRVLIVGGGDVALRKAKQFLKEEALITIVALQFHPSLFELPLHFIKREYQIADLENIFLVYAATDSLDINHQIIIDCQKKNILCGSATYDQDALFYSMAKKEHQIGTLALSMHQKLPYMQPLLAQLLDVLDDYEDKIKKIEALRPFILKYAVHKKDYFEKLYTCHHDFLDFLYQSVMQNHGAIYIYHQSSYTENYDVSKKPSIVLSLKQFEHYHELFIFPINYDIYPLFLYDGMIYQKLLEMIPNNWRNHLPLIRYQQDISYILSLYKHQNKNLICLIHPHQNIKLKQMIQNELINQGQVYDFDEDWILDKNKNYQVMIMLMSHGSHYHYVIKKIKAYQQNGYKMESLGILLDEIEIIQYIENR